MIYLRKFRMAILLIALTLMFNTGAAAQELFVFTEPASNMPAKSAGFRLNNYLMKEGETGRTNYHLLPEIMLAINKNWMAHVEGFLSSRSNNFKFEGASFYVKHRMYSIDDIHKHFRLSSYLRVAKNNTRVHQEAIDLFGHNSGAELGMVGTQLIHKTAISASASYFNAWNNTKIYKFNESKVGEHALGYTLSIGQLVYPKVYKDYNQPNLNAMIELIGQHNFQAQRGFLDVAPSVQLILKSYMRVDVGYRFPISEQLSRTANKGFLIRFEYNKFNFLK